MKAIRRSLFETNSSSVHSFHISCSSLEKLDIPSKIHFEILENPWDDIPAYKIYNSIRRKASYLYTGIIILDSKNNNHDYLNKLIKILDDYNIQYEFDDPTSFLNSCEQLGDINTDYYYCELWCDIRDLFESSKKDNVRILDFLFSEDSYVYYGEDN